MSLAAQKPEEVIKKYMEEVRTIPDEVWEKAQKVPLLIHIVWLNACTVICEIVYLSTSGVM